MTPFSSCRLVVRGGLTDHFDHQQWSSYRIALHKLTGYKRVGPGHPSGSSFTPRLRFTFRSSKYRDIKTKLCSTTRVFSVTSRSLKNYGSTIEEDIARRRSLSGKHPPADAGGRMFKFSTTTGTRRMSLALIEMRNDPQTSGCTCRPGSDLMGSIACLFFISSASRFSCFEPLILRIH